MGSAQWFLNFSIYFPTWVLLLHQELLRSRKDEPTASNNNPVLSKGILEIQYGEIVYYIQKRYRYHPNRRCNPNGTAFEMCMATNILCGNIIIRSPILELVWVVYQAKPAAGALLT